MSMASRTAPQGRTSRLLFRVLLAFLISMSVPASSYALSELKPAAEPEAVVQPDAPTAEEGESGDTLIEKVEPIIKAIAGSQNDETSFDTAALPDPVARLHALIMKAAAAGDINAVVALMSPGPDQTSIGIDTSGNDLTTALKDMSGDEDGMEILAIMLDVLSTGYAHVGKDTPDEAYIWPYFVRSQIDALTPAEKVDLMRIVTAGDYAGMLEFGGYNFYRIGISPDGRWRFFLAGD